MSDRFDSFAIHVGGLGSRRAVRRGLLGMAAGVLGFAGAITRGDLTSEAKPKRKRKPRRKRRKTRQCSGADDCLAAENPCETTICRRHRCRVRNRLDGTACGDERECRDGACVVPCDGVCAGGRICLNDTCVCPESGVCEISPTALDGWSIHDEERVSFVDGPGEPPEGGGSVRLSTIDDLGSAIGNDQFDGLPIAEISALTFATYVEDESGGVDGVPSVEFEIFFGEGIGRIPQRWSSSRKTPRMPRCCRMSGRSGMQWVKMRGGLSKTVRVAMKAVSCRGTKFSRRSRERASLADW